MVAERHVLLSPNICPLQSLQVRLAGREWKTAIGSSRGRSLGRLVGNDGGSGGGGWGVSVDPSHRRPIHLLFTAFLDCQLERLHQKHIRKVHEVLLHIAKEYGTE